MSSVHKDDDVILGGWARWLSTIIWNAAGGIKDTRCKTGHNMKDAEMEKVLPRGRTPKHLKLIRKGQDRK